MRKIFDECVYTVKLSIFRKSWPVSASYLCPLYLNGQESGQSQTRICKVTFFIFKNFSKSFQKKVFMVHKKHWKKFRFWKKKIRFLKKNSFWKIQILDFFSLDVTPRVPIFPKKITGYRGTKNRNVLFYHIGDSYIFSNFSNESLCTFCKIVKLKVKGRI